MFHDDQLAWNSNWVSNWRYYLHYKLMNLQQSLRKQAMLRFAKLTPADVAYLFVLFKFSTSDVTFWNSKMSRQNFKPFNWSFSKKVRSIASKSASLLCTWEVFHFLYFKPSDAMVFHGNSVNGRVISGKWPKRSLVERGFGVKRRVGGELTF